MHNRSWKWTLQNLTRDDWNFCRGRILDEELWSCFAYEFSREDENLRQAVAESRKRHPDYQERFGLSPTRQLADLMNSPHPPLAYSRAPEWPHTSFMSPTARKMRAGRRASQKPPQAPDAHPFYAIIPWDVARLMRAYTGNEAFPGEFQHNDWGSSRTGGLWRYSTMSDLVAFEIPWHWPDEALKKGFAQWLKANRPPVGPDDTRPIVSITRAALGAGSTKRQLLASLKALGAYRVLEAYKGDRQRAKDHEAFTKVVGKAFEHDSEWTDAVNRAKAEIRRVKAMNAPHIENERIVGMTLAQVFLASSHSRVEPK